MEKLVTTLPDLIRIYYLKINDRLIANCVIILSNLIKKFIIFREFITNAVKINDKLLKINN